MSRWKGRRSFQQRINLARDPKQWLNQLPCTFLPKGDRIFVGIFLCCIHLAAPPKYFAKDCFASVASPHDQVRFLGYFLFVEWVRKRDFDFCFSRTLRITGPCNRGVWICVAGVWDLQTTSFEIPWFLGNDVEKCCEEISHWNLRFFARLDWTTQSREIYTEKWVETTAYRFCFMVLASVSCKTSVNDSQLPKIHHCWHECILHYPMCLMVFLNLLILQWCNGKGNALSIVPSTVLYKNHLATTFLYLFVAIPFGTIHQVILNYKIRRFAGL